MKNKKQKKKSWRCKISKNIFMAACLIGILLFGLALDLAYSGKMQCKIFVKIIEWSKDNLEPLGVSYHGARDILKSNLGVLITMVSLLLTMNINVSDRAEKKAYGISRKELSFSRYKTLYGCIRGITYAAPLLMLLILNLGYCVLGYLLLLFCYVFLMLHHWLYNRSYDHVKEQKSVVRILMRYAEEGISEEKELLTDYLSLLEDIGNGIEADNGWHKAQELYYLMMEETAKKCKTESACLLCYYFFRRIFWKRKPEIAMRIIQHSIQEMDIIMMLEPDQQVKETRQAILWGMVELGVVYSEEEALIPFLDEFFDIKERSRRTIRNSGKELPIRELYRQIGGILILIEMRLERTRMQHSKQLKNRLINAISYCEPPYDNQYWNNMLRFVKLLPENEAWKAREAVYNFQKYFTDDKTKSAIKMLLD